MYSLGAAPRNREKGREMAEHFEYKVVTYDLQNRPAGETEIEGVVSLLNAHGAEGWELDRVTESQNLRYRELWLKRRIETQTGELSRRFG
jgi:hypothetical protein